eukprot:TRINITY_DN4748_c1_g1_i11.p1 TRINITY_DN4748_c1_g1~~TRINITY_DN4748_c1_g1_i11.p1  ORF type:complete len:462 (-),score=48.52 TRINITY_DN4748_c1_g1_i11:817-2202(-)
MQKLAKYRLLKKLARNQKNDILSNLGTCQIILNKRDEWFVKVSRSGIFGACFSGEVIWKDNFSVQPKNAFIEHNSEGTGRKIEYQGGDFMHELILPNDILYGGMVVQVPDTEISMHVESTFSLNLAKSGGNRYIEISVPGKLVYKSLIQTGALVAEPDYMILPPEVFQKTVTDGKTCIRTAYFQQGIRNRPIAYVKMSRSRTLKLRAVEIYNYKVDMNMLNTEHELTPLASAHLLDNSILPTLAETESQDLHQFAAYLQKGERAMLIHSWSRGDFMLLIGKLNTGEGQSQTTQASAHRHIVHQIDDEDEELAEELGEEYIVDDENYDADEEEGTDIDEENGRQNADQQEQQNTAMQYSPRQQSSSRQRQGFVNYRGVWLTRQGYGKSARIEYSKNAQRGSQKYVILGGEGNPFGGDFIVDLANNSCKVEREGILQSFYAPEAVALTLSFGMLQTVLTLEDI